MLENQPTGEAATNQQRHCKAPNPPKQHKHDVNNDLLSVLTSPAHCRRVLWLHCQLPAQLKSANDERNPGNERGQPQLCAA